MGVMSRRVVPACGNLCFFCPSMRARSRQPVKRYKKLLAEIFPRNQDAEPNDRKIAKLCEYASRNPLRIPEITSNLEQRCFKDLRNENFGCVKAVLCIYRKLLSSCKEQMPLFACSLLGIIRTLLEQTRQDEMRILGCNALVDFINCQMDGTHMFQLEGLIPKLCQLAEEDGDDNRSLCLRSAGLQVLASMVFFMGEHSHISMDFDSIISVTLENYMDFQMSSADRSKVGENGLSVPDINEKALSVPNLLINSEFEPTADTSKSPSYWSRIILRNIARLAKEATTIRRVLEPLFHNFDAENHWSHEKGVAFTLLMYLQLLMEETGQKSDQLLAILVKHMEHKNVAKQPHIQVNIVNVINQLTKNAKLQPSTAVIGTIADLVKHLRKCLQNSAELSSSRGDNDKYNTDLLLGLEKCISELSNKVGDVGPILDMMAVVLENISTNSIVARTTISAVQRTAEIISSIPNISYHKKASILAVMFILIFHMHLNHETRVGAHKIFSIVLMPALLSPLSDQNKKTSEVVSYDLSVSATVKQLTSLRLSSHQVSLLLSSIWVQATSTDNTPANFEAMAHSFYLAILFTRSKTSSHMALVRSFQLAFSLRSISLDQEGVLQPSRRRSLFTLSSYMIIFSARAGNIPELIPIVKASLTDQTVDPYLKLVEDMRLQAVHVKSDVDGVAYGSQEDDAAASKTFLAIELDDLHLKETVISHFMTKFDKFYEDDLSSIKKQILEGFSPDDAYPFGAPLFMETPRPCSPLAQMEFHPFEEILPLATITDDEAFPEANGSQLDRKASVSLSTLDVLSVNELLDSVLETARQVASFSVSATPIPYDQMRSQCEALVIGKQQKMSVLHSFKHQQDGKATLEENKNEVLCLPNLEVELYEDLKVIGKEQAHGRGQLALCALEYGQHSFKLPPSSPYDKFLKAAGC
ncbi:putative serine/threonine-protein kinase GCN2-like [Hibiscus syriacus]|uniref:Serine/threonine-protein kinase GCN2-like n=1 Tax=Hibiscus syriacus TaxID=106335 RepID=A0A6A3BP35_HIBSY|nr:putative serine/threonine-protein kinase GCN2-like [Hibiscus syriacus]